MNDQSPPDHEDVQSVDAVQSMRSSLTTSLRKELSTSHAHGPFMLKSLLDFIDKLRLLSAEHRKLLTVLKEMPDMSQNEMFGLIE